jgi:micrococcal nuclease
MMIQRIGKAKLNDFKKTITLSIVICLAVMVLPSLAYPWKGKVVGISDGDTITVLDRGKGHRVRLFGIDCPEKDQDFGSKAKKFTSDMVYGKEVSVDNITTDGYGRIVGRVTVNGKNLNEELVRNGLAWWYRKYATHEEKLKELEESARSQKIGLWSRKNPVPPWNFRHNKR